MGALKWIQKSFWKLLGRVGTLLLRPVGAGSDLPAPAEYRIYQSPSAPNHYNQAIGPLETVSLYEYGSNFALPLAPLMQDHTSSATFLRCWDDLNKPHQLGLEQSPNQGWEDIFYGP